ncbi:reductive dehalogenase [Dehalococcoides mccartyi]|uniref:reductive dehalogenase n=1 Tax=Dehalococcoides mccartyi TaxID=61435 RepID=UPI002AFF4DE9|nr:reductive dehalogenase [Dehalococcoides mccartyi]MEA2121895.1 3-chloro-4-hydroxyphenylacetate reductive dehalogenase [Dehalococcoides mccartyi]
MSKFHSTISRRDFMKGLGIAGVGASTVAATGPIFKDLDDLTASPSGSFKRSWWVKEREFRDLTIDIDWNVLDIRKPFTIAPLTTKVLEEAPRIERRGSAMRANVKGDRLQDQAVTEALDRVWFYIKAGAPAPLNQNINVASNQFLNGGPDYWGAPRWQGTPEENLQLVRSVMHYFGSPQVFVFEIDEYIKKLFTEEVAWGDVETPQINQSNGIITLPNKCRWGIIGAIKQNTVIQKYGIKVHEDGPAKGYQPHFAEASCYDAYIDLHIVSLKIQAFLLGLGYSGVDAQFVGSGRHDPIRGLLGQYAVPFSAFAGLGEMSRANIICSPEYGLGMRRPVLMLTDLPLTPTKPVDSGIFSFCHTCKICATNCPSGQLSKDDEPTWEVHTYQGQPINRSGICSYRADYVVASDFGCPRDCSLCQGICPFNHPNEAIIHPIIKGTVGVTPVLDGFFANMERFIYSPENMDMDAWWKRDLNSWSGDALPGFPNQVA